MTQLAAIFIDAYRELNSRKLFWISLILSGLVVTIFGLVGINEEGLRIIIWDVSLPLNTTLISSETFYKSMFVNLGIGFWLGWLATILALVSTASIFPDLISSGSIELVLSKPIGRVRLFLTKYASGLLFVALQVTVFSAASFVVLGLRGKTWEPAVFLAVPLVVIFFSYLFCMCVLLGILTRSTITALLLTLLIWFLIFLVHGAESAFLGLKLMAEQRIDAIDTRITRLEEELEARGESEPPEGADPADSRFERQRDRIESLHVERDESEKTLRTFETIHGIVYGAKTVLPKTTETVGLMERWMIDLAELPLPEEEQGASFSETGGFRPDQEELQREAIEAVRSRSVGWIMGTSLVFEAIMLGLGAFMFQRRDF